MTINSYKYSKSSKLLALSWQYDVLSRQLLEKEDEYKKLSEALKNCEDEIDKIQKEIDDDKSIQQA